MLKQVLILIFSLCLAFTTSALKSTQNYVRIGYYSQWSTYSDFTPADLYKNGVAASITHLYYTFAAITDDGTCSIGDTARIDYTNVIPADASVSGLADAPTQPLRGNYNQLKQLKVKYPNLKLIMTIGGPTGYKQFSNVALTDTSRKKFVSSCVDLYIKGNYPVIFNAGGIGSGYGVFDGFDIDWEYPAVPTGSSVYRPEDTQTFTLLLQEFRDQLDAYGAITNKRYLISAATSSTADRIAKLEVAKIAAILDYIGIMTYSFHGAWSPTGPTAFHSNLYQDLTGPGEGSDKKLSVDFAVQTYLAAGAPANKLVVGIPYFGAGWTGVSNTNNGFHAAATAAAQGGEEAGTDDYKNLVKKPGKVYYDNTTKQMWKYDGNEYWTYDDVRVLAYKTAYIVQNRLAGTMVWSLEREDARATLSKAIYNGLTTGLVTMKLPISSNTPTNTEQAPKDYVRMGYFTQWSAYQRAKLIDLDKSGVAATLTHLYYAFAIITSNGLCTIDDATDGDPKADYGRVYDATISIDGVADTKTQVLRGNFNQIKKLKAKYPNLKVIISLGGASGSGYFSDIALTDTGRKAFVSSCIDTYIKGNLPVVNKTGGAGVALGIFDGVDIDWEYPAYTSSSNTNFRAEDTQTFTLLLQEFRDQLDAFGATTGKQYILTAAMAGTTDKLAVLEIPKISQILDYMGLMTYSFRGTWNAKGPTGFHSNLYNDPACPDYNRNLSISNVVDNIIKAGAPAEKVVLGFAYYGRGWTGVASGNNGLYQTATGAATGTYGAGVDNYNTLVLRGGTTYYNEVSKQSWMYDGTNFWSYDDTRTIAEKTAYVTGKRLAGSMAWSLDGDDANGTISKAIYAGLTQA